MSKNSRLVYSTDSGRVKTSDSAVVISDQKSKSGDGFVRIQRETKGRGGKAVSVVSGLPTDQLKPLCKMLKSKCATGGAVKENLVEIQGDHRQRIQDLLQKQGFQVKLSGG